MLASTADFEAITGQTLDGPTTARVLRLLEFASDAVLASAHGQTIAQATTTDVLRASEGVFYFPQRPVDPTSVVMVMNDITVDPSMYRVEPGGYGHPAKLIRRFYGGDYRWGQVAGFPWDQFPGRYPYVGRRPEAEATVTYTHGWDPVPGQLVAAVVAMANGVFTGRGGGQEVRSQAAGSFSETLTAPQTANFAILADTQAIIDRLCKVKPGPNVPVAT
jgi:hypothetical protein